MEEWRSWLQAYPAVETVLWLVGIFAVAWLSDALAKRYLLGAISRVVRRTEFTWDDALQRRLVFRRLAHLAPAMVLYYGIPLAPGLPEELGQVLQRGAMAVMVLVLALAADAFLSAVNDIYATRPHANTRPIKGYLQIVKIVLYIAAGIVVLSLLVDRSPVVFLSGFGALTAIILLVFRDTILSLVASITLTQNDMLAVGDWIEMPKYGADGDVVDIALHTVKVQNWDKTITTIPTHQLISDSFKNWRGMKQAGGRRISRSFRLDLNSIRFLTDDEIRRFRRYELLEDYFRQKLEEIEAFNARKRREEEGSELEAPEDEPREGDTGSPGSLPVIPNLRRLTNVGTLRAYIVSYLKQHPGLRRDMTLMVRQLEPGPDGLPMQIYVFSNDTNWVSYEGIQADVFDHIFAIIPEFGLRVFQTPSGQDLARLTSGTGSSS